MNCLLCESEDVTLQGEGAPQKQRVAEGAKEAVPPGAAGRTVQLFLRVPCIRCMLLSMISQCMGYSRNPYG